MRGETGAVIGMRDVGSSETFNTSSYKQAFFFFDEMLKLNNKQTKKAIREKGFGEGGLAS